MQGAAPFVAILWLALGGSAPLLAATDMPAVKQPRPAVDMVAPRWQTFRARFEARECWFVEGDAPLAGGLACGTVDVPEDRTDPDSQLISLAVMRIPAASQPAPSGGLVWLEPGPGYASISARRVHAVREGRLGNWHGGVDLVFFDQRGTGYSGRDFCRLVRDAYTYGVPVEPEGEDRFRANMRRCLDEARAQGIPIDAYSSWHIALDARDIRIALGLDRWNVFGYGTSTEIAQAIVQVDGEGVRSVVLDGPVPTRRGLSRAASHNMDRALRALADLCRQDAACAAEHGDFHQRVLTLLDGYEREPLLIEGLDREAATDGRLVFDDRIAATFLMFMLYNGPGHADLPVVLDALEDRDVGAITNYAQAWFQPPNGRNSQATRFAIKCRNNSGGRDVPPSALAIAQREAPGLYRRLGLFRYADDCAALPYGPPDPSARATRSDVPALVTDGRLDPVGTVEAAQAIAAGFSNGQRVLFPYAGVSPLINDLHGCGGDVLGQFLASPTAPLDTGCVADVEPPRFVTGYRRTSVPGRLMIALSAGTYPVLPALLALSLTVPFLALPAAWLARRLRRRKTGNAVPAPELVAWLALATALCGLGYLVQALLAWADVHRNALPAAIPGTAVVSIWTVALATVLALMALAMTLRARRSPRSTPGALAVVWIAVASLCNFAWILAVT